MTINNLIPAVAYLRMSRKQQDTSIEQQRTQIIAWANGKYRIIRWYVDEGKSGSKDVEKRTEFLKMIDDAEKQGDFDAVLCLDNSRFGRLDALEGGVFKLRLRDAGVYLDTVIDGLSDWESETGQIVDTVHAVKNHSHSRLISQKTCKGRLDATLKGKPPGNPPYGMHKVVIDAQGNERIIKRGEKFRTPKTWTYKYVPGEPDEVKIVRWLFNTYAKRDISLRQLAKTLNEKGVPSPGGKTWNDRTISNRIFLNRAYIGDAQWGVRACKGSFHISRDGEAHKVKGKVKRTTTRPVEEQTICENAFRGIVSRKVFDAVQDKLIRNPTRGGNAHGDKGYPLTGILVCGKCGCNMVAKRDTRSGVVRYYCGKANRNPGGGCSKWAIAERDILPFVLDKLRERMDAEAIHAMEAEPVEMPKSDRQAIERKLRSTEQAIERGSRRLCMVDDSLVPSIEAELKRLQAERVRLQQELTGTDDAHHEWAKLWVDWWQTHRGKLVFIPVSDPAPPRTTTIQDIDGNPVEQAMIPAGNADDDRVGVEPVVIRETLKSMKASVVLRWTRCDNGGRQRWMLDKGSIRVEMDYHTLRTSSATG